MLFMSLYLHINIFTRQPGLFVTIDELKYHLMMKVQYLMMKVQ